MLGPDLPRCLAAGYCQSKRKNISIVCPAMPREDQGKLTLRNTTLLGSPTLKHFPAMIPIYRPTLVPYTQPTTALHQQVNPNSQSLAP